MHKLSAREKNLGILYNELLAEYTAWKSRIISGVKILSAREIALDVLCSEHNTNVKGLELVSRARLVARPRMIYHPSPHI